MQLEKQIICRLDWPGWWCISQLLLLLLGRIRWKMGRVYPDPWRRRLWFLLIHSWRNCLLLLLIIRVLLRLILQLVDCIILCILVFVETVLTIQTCRVQCISIWIHMLIGTWITIPYADIITGNKLDVSLWWWLFDVFVVFVMLLVLQCWRCIYDFCLIED